MSIICYYKKHIFICTNQKSADKTCCANNGGEIFFDYLKLKLLDAGLHGPNGFRVSKSGCLGRCSLGPCMVIYPDNVWYTYHSFSDLDEIITQYLIAGITVKRLLII